MNALERTRECKGTGIPPQHYPGLLLGLGGACTNSIGYGKKRDDMLVLQRSDFGPLLWNITFYGILKEDVLSGVSSATPLMSW